MDFAFSEEQLMLKDQARSFLADKWPPERLEGLDGRPWDEGLWRSIVDLGWVGLSVAEDAGGTGMSFLDEAVLFEELGYALYAGPYFSTVALGLPALAPAPALARRVVEEGLPVAFASTEPGLHSSLTNLLRLGTKAERKGDEWLVTGEKDLVLDADAAGVFVVTAESPEGPGVWAIFAGDGAAVSARETVDSSRRLSHVTFSGARAELVVAGPEADALLRRVRLRALAALSMEAVGISQRVLELGVAYTSERKQFGRAIAEYQAVAHQLADTYMETELARSLAYWAAWAVAVDDERAELAAEAAKAAASEAAVSACERSIQVHGGIGFTWEHVLHRYLKRSDWLARFEGSATDQRKQIADKLFGGEVPPE